MTTDPTHVRYVYRCRLCGEIFATFSGADYKIASEAIDLCAASSGTDGLWILRVHSHPDGSIGIADLQGARVEKAQ